MGNLQEDFQTLSNQFELLDQMIQQLSAYSQSQLQEQMQLTNNALQQVAQDINQFAKEK
jgi:hypothetical protein